MCGVIGIRQTEANLDQVQDVFRESMIRGKHATGISWLKDGQINTVREPIPADEFIDKFDFDQIVDNDGTVSLIGHIRYSTSDIRFNQPFTHHHGEFSIVHNGVLSQEDPGDWKYKTNTENDSEMIIHSIAAGQIPLYDFRPASMAVVELHKTHLKAYRNEARPLWYVLGPGSNIIFASTMNILKRAGVSKHPNNCKMFREYILDFDPGPAPAFYKVDCNIPAAWGNVVDLQ